MGEFPNKATQFKEGNKFGGKKPKGSKSFKTLLKRYLNAKIDCKPSPFTKDEKITAKDALIIKLITLGMAGNLTAIINIIERLDGKPNQPFTGEIKNNVHALDDLVKKVEGLESNIQPDIKDK